MHAVAFDTLEAAKRLRAAGFDEKQSDALVGAFASNMLQGLSSKEDLNHLEESIRKDLKHMEERQDAKFDLVYKEFDAVRNEMAQMEQRQDAKFDQINAKFDQINDALGHRLTVRVAGIMIAVLGSLHLISNLFFTGG